MTSQLRHYLLRSRKNENRQIISKHILFDSIFDAEQTLSKHHTFKIHIYVTVPD